VTVDVVDEPEPEPEPEPPGAEVGVEASVAVTGQMVV